MLFTLVTTTNIGCMRFIRGTKYSPQNTHYPRLNKSEITVVHKSLGFINVMLSTFYLIFHFLKDLLFKGV